MEQVFERTKATPDVKKAFMERWTTLSKLSEKIYEFVRLQVNLLVRKDPEKDQQIWKEFIVENIALMNDEFFLLGKKVFTNLLDQAITDEVLRSSFLEAWERTKETITSIKETPNNN